ncbi:MAG TPA: FHA domain-containing protein [Steroidobacteraceae bacterium]|nr:FHA domain-containing protein [Steroidobacteraceae bacterium]
MATVNSAPSSEVDNEATAELPVLDVAAYESTLRDEETVAHTDTWVLPSDTFKTGDATTEMPAVKADSIPTLTKAVPAYDLDHSGTHEMPAMLLGKTASPARHAKTDPPKTAKAPRAPNKVVTPAPAQAAPAPAPAAIVLPPSPPLIEELRGALANAERRITELDERARIADAERSVAIARANAECAQLREQLAAHLEALATSKERLDVQRTDQAELADSYFARGDRIAALEKQLADQAEVLRQTRSRLADSEARCETLDCDGMNLRATVARRNSHISMLEADLAARQQREALLGNRLTDALASIDPNVPRLHEDIAARDEKLRELKAELELARARVREMDDDLQVAEESIRQLENDLGDKSSKLAEASVTVEEWRAVIAESQRSILQRDSRIQQLETDLQQHRFSSTLDTGAQTGEEAALEGPARVLIRTDGNTDFVHVLGRRTRIGRGPDNEIVLDTKHISRYHAVLLAGPVNTSIEDLNSTNGVFVNGKRVNRQVLNTGDKVTIGKTQFRYTVRD